MSIARTEHGWRPAQVEGLPQVFTGGWVGYAGYDTVRYVYSGRWAGLGLGLAVALGLELS